MQILQFCKEPNEYNKKDLLQKNKDKKLNKIFINFLCKFYYKIPKSFIKIGNRIIPIIENFFEIFLIIKGLKLKIYMIKGQEKNSNKTLEILYIGNDISNFSYIINVLNLKKPSIEKKGKTFLWNIQKNINKLENTDAIIIKNSYFYTNYLHRNGFIVIPEYIEMILDTSKPYKDLYNDFHRSVKKRLRRSNFFNYSFEISDELDKLKLFYNDFYIPYIQKKFDDSAIIANFSILKFNLKRGRLIFIKKDDEYIFCSLLADVHKNTVMKTHSAIKDKKINYLDKNINYISTFFSIIWAIDNNVNNLSLGLCRTFLNDGIFRHKRQWNPTVKKCNKSIKGEKTGVFGLKINNYSSTIKDFLTNNPFISIENNKIKAIIYKSNYKQLSDDKIKHIKNMYNLPGISDIVIAYYDNGKNKIRYVSIIDQDGGKT